VASALNPPPGGWPRITLVTPSYNQAWALERTMRSVLDQGYPDLEYLVMDGGSDDGSVDIIKRYESRLKCWRSTRDSGQTAAIIEGLGQGTGHILGYLNSDDVLLPGSLFAVARRLAGVPSAWMVGWSLLVDAQDRVLMHRTTYPVDLPLLWHHRYILPQESIFFTRTLYDRVGGLDPSYEYAMDAHLWLRMMSVETPLFEAVFLGAFRVHPQQKTAVMVHYRDELERVIADVANWRSARGMTAEPPPPRLGRRLFKLAKAAHYLQHVGPYGLWRVWCFQRKYRRL
jgi:glycosyltransferase involved in cell wall biosynthesis